MTTPPIDPANHATERPGFTVPEARGRISFGQNLGALTWMRVGGAAEVFFQPADTEDLATFLAALAPEVPVFVMGVGSNLIVRDGGVPGVVIRLGRGFTDLIQEESGLLCAGAALPDAQAARKAAKMGCDLTFLRTIPGTIGGAVCMNAGCYGSYMADVLEAVEVVSRSGEVTKLGADALGLAYRSSNLPEGWVITRAWLRAPAGQPDILDERMADQLARRDASQPTKDRTAGSTFRNPAGFSSTGRADDVHDLKAWKLIEDAGLRGARLGGAQMNEKHPNFLTNAENATAQDLENLGELVRKKVVQSSGIELEWEIKRVGIPAPEIKADENRKGK